MKNKPPRRTDVLFLRGISADLKLQFKAYCAIRGTSMKSKIVEFMKECAKEDFEHEQRRDK